VRSVEGVKSFIDHALVSDGLRAKAMRGGVWLGGGNVAEQASRFARNMLLTRLLAPGAFGTMAIVMSSAGVVDSLTDVGVRQAVIQNPRGGEDAYLNASWWMGTGRALGVYALIFLMAPWVARFYRNPELSILLRVALLSMLFTGSPNSIRAMKEMDFRRWTMIINGGGICGVILTVSLSFFIRDVWALVIGFCGEGAFRCILSYILCPGWPSWGWDRAATRDLLKFSRGVVGLSFLNLIFARSDIFVLAKLFSTSALGLYTMAVVLIQTPAGFIMNMLSQTCLPALAKVHTDAARVNRILMEITSWIVLLGLPAVAVLYVCGPSFLLVAYGRRYVVVAGTLAVASCVSFANVLNSLITTAFYAEGRPELHRRAVAATAITMLIAIYPACRWLGVMGGQVAALLAIGVGFLLQLLRMRKMTNLSLRSYGKPFVQSTLVTAGILALCLGARYLGLATRPVANIALGIAACAVAYALCIPALMRTRDIA
jgi:O-antigen/teichoic acid export membrane protein